MKAPAADRLDRKRRAAVKKLGTKWLLHPANRVRRLAEPLTEPDIRRHLNAQTQAPVILLDDRRKA